MIHPNLSMSSTQLRYVDKWHDDPLIANSRLLTLNKIAHICSKGEVSKRMGENKNTIVCAIETALFMDAASKEEYMNQNTLRERLLSLCQRNMKKQTFGQKVGNHPTNFASPTTYMASHESMHSQLDSSEARSKRVFLSEQKSTNNICSTSESLYGVQHFNYEPTYLLEDVVFSSKSLAHRSYVHQHDDNDTGFPEEMVDPSNEPNYQLDHIVLSSKSLANHSSHHQHADNDNGFPDEMVDHSNEQNHLLEHIVLSSKSLANCSSHNHHNNNYIGFSEMVNPSKRLKVENNCSFEKKGSCL